MLKKLLLSAVAAVALVLALPTEVDAYGAVHASYTHVGPAGVYHTGGTAVAGPRGVATTGHTTAVGAGGGVYHSGTTAAVGAGGGVYRTGYAAGYGPYGGAGYGYSAHGANYNANAAAAAANGAYR
jgi:hypothetical protein